MLINDQSTRLPRGEYLTQEHHWFLLHGIKSQKASHSGFLFTPHHSLCFHSASSSHFFLPQPFSSHSHFSPSSILCLPHSLPHPFCLYPSLSLRINLYLRLSVWNPSEESFLITKLHLSLPPPLFPLIISLCTRLKHPHAGRGGDSRGGSERGKGKEEEEGREDEAAEGWENKGLATVCSSEAVSCNRLHDASSGFLCPVPSSPSTFFFVFQPLLCLLSPCSLPPPHPLFIHLFLLTSSCLPTPSPSFLLSFILLLSALWSYSKAEQSNPLMGEWVCWKCGGIFPRARVLLNITAFCEALSLSMRQTHFIRTEPNLPDLLPNCVNELGLKWCRGSPQVGWAWWRRGVWLVRTGWNGSGPNGLSRIF